jgi:hypothetical protein
MADRKYNQAIFYNPNGRGLRLAVCWTFEEDNMLGFMYGYEGGGAYCGYYFKAVCEEDKVVNLYATDDIMAGDCWENDWMSKCQTNLPEISKDNQDRCEESMCCIMDYSVIETGDDDEEFLIPESNFPKMELQDDGTLIFIEIEDEKQLGLYKQLQPRWNFLSRIEFNETGVTNEVASTE